MVRACARAACLLLDRRNVGADALHRRARQLRLCPRGVQSPRRALGPCRHRVGARRVGGVRRAKVRAAQRHVESRARARGGGSNVLTRREL
tara:strand:- start:3 stop:275 length:273 start_codon:yes stop_codon:yes gene_type:complete